MRAAARPIVLFALLVGYITAAQTYGLDPTSTVADPINYFGFAKGSPSPTTGGVDVTVDQKADTGYTCTKITFYVIDTTTGDTVRMEAVDNPGASVSKSYTDLGSNRSYRVAVEAVFETGGAADLKSVNAVITTQ